MSNFRKVEIGNNELAYDAWGKSKVVIDNSILHGMWTFDVPTNIWKRKLNGVEVIDGSIDAFIRSENGSLVVEAVTNVRHTLSSLRHPRYQPNRGHLFSDSSFIKSAGSGKLYVVKRTHFDGVVSDTRTEISSSADLSKGNVNDIQIQWRGVGDFKHFQNLAEVYHNEQLGTLTSLSISNPALSISYEAAKGSHTLGNLLRNNSCVRYGIFTEENGIFYEYEYESPFVNPRIDVGCTDVTSEGGKEESRTYSSATTGVFTSLGGDEQAVLVIKSPDTRTVNGTLGSTYSAQNTRDCLFKSLSFAINDETFVRVYKTRDSSAVSAVFDRNWSDDIDFSIHANSGAVNSITSFDNSKAELIFAGNVEQDIPTSKLFSNGLWITNGDCYVVTVDASGAGSDIMSITAELEVEK